MAGATTTPAAKPTSLTIRTSSPSVTAGTTEVISGTLATGHTVLANEPVLLDTVDVHGARHKTGLAGATAKNTGLVTFRFIPKATATYELVFPGARGLAPSHSGEAVVKVVKIATKLTATPLAQSIKAGSKATITGILAAGTTPLAGKGVVLYRVNARGHLVARVGRPHITAKATGKVTFTFSPPPTTATYELVFRATPLLAGSKSNTVTVTVK